MPRKRVKVPEASAKLQAVAKASYQRKRTTTEVIPPDVTRAKAGAWLDLISPWTEWAGLKGDQIRHKRELLRLQREEVLTTIALHARKQLNQTAVPIKPVPNKFLVPFLEKASLEDEHSELIGKWANLLTSAAIEFNHHMVRFCTILAEIGPTEVKFLHRLCRENRSSPRRGLSWVEDVPMAFSLPQLVRDVDRAIELSKGPEENIHGIIAKLELPGGLITTIGIDDHRTDDMLSDTHDLDDSVWESSISLLQSLGLLENHMFISGEVEYYSWYAETVSLTSFGVAFVSACDPEVRQALKRPALKIKQPSQ
jgi:hypothetical protein